MPPEMILTQQSDSRLLEAMRLIDSGTVKLLSLDIFDTLLWRKFPRPVDLFLLLGEQFKREGWLLEGIVPECFAELRTKAEMLARAQKAAKLNLDAAHYLSQEVTLKEIYWHLTAIFNKVTIEQMVAGKKGIINEADIYDLVEMEIVLEKELLEYDQNMIYLITYAQAKNIPILLVSNTYFEYKQLQTLLDKPLPSFSKPLFDCMAAVFASCEEGCKKSQGLFKKVLEKFHLPAHEILHIGDDLLQDHLAGQAAGFQTIHYEKFSKEQQEILDREWPKTNTTARHALLDRTQGDFGLTALRTRMNYHHALAKLTTSDSFFWKYGATIIGPCLTGFTHWIYKRCRELGQTQVFCLMREGHLYAELIKKCASQYEPFAIQAHEFWGSKQFAIRTCIFTGSEQEIEAVHQAISSFPFTVETFCKSIGIEMAQLKKFAKFKHAILTNDDISLRETLFKHLASEESLRLQIVACSAEKRKNWLTHLSNLVDLKSISKLVLVDIGWGGTIQGALQVVLAMEGYQIEVHGLYLATVRKNHFPILQGFIREGYLLKAGFPQDVSDAIKKGCLIFEAAATVGLNPLDYIDAQGTIHNIKLHYSTQQTRQMQLMQNGIFDFLESISRYTESKAIVWDASSEALENQLRHILVRSTSYPTREEALKLGAWRYDRRSGQDETHYIAKDPYSERFIKDMLPGMSFDHVPVDWPIALAAKYNKYFARAAQAVLMEVLPKKCFLSQDFIKIKAFQDSGKGYPQTAVIQKQVHSNVNRHFYTQFQLISYSRAIQGIKIELQCPHALIRIKSLRLVFNTLQSTKKQQHIFFETNQSAAFTCSAEQIEHNLFHCNEDSFTLTCPLDVKNIYMLKASLCFEYFNYPSHYTKTQENL